MIVHELISMKHIFTEDLKEGYHVLLGKYRTLDVRMLGTDHFQEIDCGTEEIVEVIFDPGNEYSLIRLGSYKFKNKALSLDDLLRKLQTNHREIFQQGAVSA